MMSLQMLKSLLEIVLKYDWNVWLLKILQKN